MSDLYRAEIAFLNRRLLTTKINWQVLPAMSQIATPAMSEDKAKLLVSKLKDALLRKAKEKFHTMVFLASSKLQGGTRVIIAVPLLREFFSDEIDGWGGGGGRGYNPLSTRPTKPGGTV